METRETQDGKGLEKVLDRIPKQSNLCTNWVCAGTFDDHKWTSESIIAQHVQEVMYISLGCKIGIPCVVQ